jgi:hypothetical protein
VTHGEIPRRSGLHVIHKLEFAQRRVVVQYVDTSNQVFGRSNQTIARIEMRQVSCIDHMDLAPGLGDFLSCLASGGMIDIATDNSSALGTEQTRSLTPNSPTDTGYYTMFALESANHFPVPFLSSNGQLSRWDIEQALSILIGYFLFFFLI